MSYETGTSGLGVGKYYGERAVGNVAGVTIATSGEGRMVWEFDGKEFAQAEAKTLTIPADYGLITAVYGEVKEAFDGSASVEIEYDGSAILPAKIDVTSVGMSDGALAAPVSIEAGKEVSMIVVAGSTSVGKGKVIVEFTRV